MRWANLFFCCIFLAFTIVGGGTPLLASDLEPPRQSYPDDRQSSDNGQSETDAVEFCDTQGQICRKICRLRFRDDLVGCPQSCETRVGRCTKTGCFRWTEPDFLIAERFGGFKCAQ
jgi:hypothetical protein